MSGKEGALAMMNKLVLATALTLAAGGTWAADHSHEAPHAAANKGHLCDSCGTVRAVRMEKRKGEGGPVGILGGAAVGGLLGNQVGRGGGNTLATIGGAVAGGYAGNEVQKHVTSKQVWITEVRMRDGRTRTFEQAARPAWKNGSVVKLQGRGIVMAGRDD
jgi:outer membrane lipoprotein SlyB